MVQKAKPSIKIQAPRLAKLTLPRLGKVIHRPRLIQQLKQLSTHKLIWIAAPGGSGKTTLAIDYLEKSKPDYLWYQIDSGDQDIASFFNNLAQAAERGNRFKRKLQRFTPEYALGLPAYAHNFFRDLFARLDAPACIVFDNYQEVGEDAALNTVLAHALDELPEGITIIVMSRNALPTALVRHETNGQVAHLTADALELTTEEQAELITLTLGERQLKPQDVQRLQQSMRGWVSGVLLALREIKNTAVGDEGNVIDAIGHASAHDPAHIFDYFASELMTRLDAATREFLYAVALLPVMTVALCESLTGNDTAKTILQRLVRENFFMTRCGLLSVSYEFHPLFRQFLLAQSETQFERARLQQLKQQAGRLLAQAGEGESAVALLAATQDWATVIELIKTYGAELEKQGRLQTLQQWITALPEGHRASDPWLLYWSGIAQLPTDPFAAYDLFERAYPMFSNQDDVLGLYLCWIGAAMALFFRHDDMNPAPGWIKELEQLRKRHPKWPSIEIQARVTTAAVGTLVMGDATNPMLSEWVARAEKLYRFVPLGVVRCFVGHQLGVYYTFYHHIDKLKELAEQLKPLIASPKTPDLARLLAAAIPVYAAWQTGNLARANEVISQGLSLLEASGVYVTSQWFFGSSAMARLSHADLEGAQELTERFRNNTKPRHRLELVFHELMVGWRALMLGDYQAAKARTEASLALVESLHNQMFLLLALQEHAQVLIEVGEFVDAHRFIDRYRKLSQETGNKVFSEFCANYLEAYLLDRSGASPAEFVRPLQRSFSAAAKNNWVVNSFWEPRIITRLCTLALQHHIEPDYAKRLIRIYHLAPPSQGELIEAWPWPVRVYTLDRFAIQLDDKPLPLDAKGQKKPFELLKVIIALGGRDVALGRVLEALWPEAEGDAQMRNFTIALHRLRQVIGSDAVLFAEQRLSLDAQRVWVDVWCFERYLTQLTKLLTQNNTAEFVTQLAKSLAIYRRPFLDGDEAEWVIAQRERVRDKVLRLLSNGAETLSRAQHHADAIACCERALDIEPLAEAVYRAVIKSQLALGERAAAISTYRRCQTVLLRELGVKPAAATEALYRQVMQ